MDRKLDTSTGAGGATTVARTRFDSHLNDCRACQPWLCQDAQQLWRQVCLTALKQSCAVDLSATDTPGVRAMAAELRLAETAEDGAL